MTNTLNRVAIASLVLSGCVVDDDVDDPLLSNTSQNSEITNGISLNGISMNGISMNGISMNGISMNGISMNGISMNGISMNGISMNGTSLAGTVGSTWLASLSNGGSATLRVDTATRGAGANSDVGMYGISIQSDTGWQPLCGVDAAGAPILALAVPGTWDLSNGAYTASMTEQTFACRAKTVAKCVELGYKPWTGRGDHLAACTRLLRGDYCGDGQPYTVDGTTLNLYDNVGLQADAASWALEAEWTPNGARCMTLTGQSRFLLTPNNVPTCMTGQNKTLPVVWSCGTSFGGGALLINEMPSPSGTTGTTSTTTTSKTASKASF